MWSHRNLGCSEVPCAARRVTGHALAAAGENRTLQYHGPHSWVDTDAAVRSAMFLSSGPLVIINHHAPMPVRYQVAFYGKLKLNWSPTLYVGISEVKGWPLPTPVHIARSPKENWYTFHKTSH